MSPIRAHDFRQGHTPIPQGLVALWGGTRAAVASYLVPLGWELADGNASTNDPAYTKPSLQTDSFLRSVDTAGNAPTGQVGSSTHNHSLGSHTNDLTSGASEGNTHRYFTSYGTVAAAHTHSTQGATESFVNQTVTPNFTTGVAVVYCLKGSSTLGQLTINDVKATAMLPLKVIGMWHSSAAIPSGWAECSGATSNGITTINLQGYFVRGIATTGTDPGGYSDTTTHTHSVSHYHGSTAASPSDGHYWDTGSDDGDGGVSYSTLARGSHTHGNTSTDTGNLSDATNDLVHHKTRFITFVGHGPSRADNPSAQVAAGDLEGTLVAPRGLAMFWGHPVGEKPGAWSHADGTGFANGGVAGHTNKPNFVDRFIRLTTGDGGVTVTGTAGSHTHNPTGSHTHVVNAVGDGPYAAASWQSSSAEIRGHTHGTGGPGWTGNTAGDATPKHKRVAVLVRD